MKNNLSVLFIIFVLMIGLVSAFEFDNVKSSEFEGEYFSINENTVLEYNKLWEKYSPVEIKNSFGLGKKLFSGAITEHTETCGSDCESIIDVYSSGDAPIVEDIRFIGDQPSSYNIQIYKGTESVLVNDYETQCTTVEEKVPTSNESEIKIYRIVKHEECEEVKIGEHYEEEPVWEDYKIGTKLPEGDYKVKIEGSKNPIDSVDWQIKTQGKWIDEWAWWSSSYGYKRDILNSTSNLLLPVNGTSPSDIDSNGIEEWIYAIPNGSLYYNDQTDVVNANDTDELCLVDTKNQRKSCPIPPELQEGMYNFDLTSGDVWNPLGGNGTVVGTIDRGVEGKFHNAFDWTQQGANRIDLAESLDNNEFTLSMWVEFDSTYDYGSNSRGSLFGEINSASASKDGWVAGINNDGNVTMQYYSGNSRRFLAETTNSLVDGLNHLTVTYKYGETNEVTVYINNQSEELGNPTVQATAHDTVLHIGMGVNYYGGAPNYRCFRGRIDEVNVWDKELTTSEVSELYDSENIYLKSELPDLVIINITNPKNNSVYNKIVDGTNISNYTYPEGVELNWTVNSTFLDSCWYSYNGTNNTVTCSDNTTTFNMTSQENITFYASSTYGLVNSSTHYWEYNYLLTETLSDSDECSENDVEYDNLLDGKYTLNATTCNTFGRCSSTENRVFYIDTKYPLISYDSSSTETNTSVNFNSQDWIFINVTYDEINEKNITFNLYTDNEVINQTTISDMTQIGVQDNSSYSINFTELDEDMYFFNVTMCDIVGNCNTTSFRNYGVEKTNFSLELEFNSLDAELGSPIQVNATNNLDEICVDIDHPDYGTNYSCGTFETGFDVIIDYFNTNKLANDNISQVYKLSEGIQEITFSAHEHMEVDNVSFNISDYTSGNEEENIYFNMFNSTEIDRYYLGFLFGDKIYQEKSSSLVLQNGSAVFTRNEEDEITYTSEGFGSLGFYFDDNAKDGNVLFNLTGEGYGGEFNNPFTTNEDVDEINDEASNSIVGGGFVSLGGTDPQNMVVDDFSDGSINSSLWTPSPVSGTYYADTNSRDCGQITSDGYDLTVSHSESGGQLISDVQFTENFDSYGDDCNDECTSCNSIGYESGRDTRSTYMNLNGTNAGTLWTVDNYNFNMSIDIVAKENNDHVECRSPSVKIYFGGAPGGKNIFSSQWNYCEDDKGDYYGDCRTYVNTHEPLEFNLSKLENASWKVQIEGFYRINAEQDDYNNDCGDEYWDYNYTAGTLHKYYFNPSSSCNNPDYSDWSNLPNDFLIGSPTPNTNALYYEQYFQGDFDSEDNEGCDYIYSTVKTGNINNTRYNVSDTITESNVIHESSGDISKATMDIESYGSPYFNTTVSPYLSADGGENWENVNNGVEHTFVNRGTELMWKVEQNIDGGGYVPYSSFLTDVNVYITEGYPSDLEIDFGNDGVTDYEINGELNETNSPYQVNFTFNNISQFIVNETADVGNNLYQIPISIYSDSSGFLITDAYNLSYNPNPVSLNVSTVNDWLFENADGNTNISFELNGTENTIVNLSDIVFNYAGGNKTINVTAHNSDYSQILTRAITYFYSRWDYWFVPDYVDWLEFIPRSPTEKNVTPYGQDSNGIMNITNYGYGLNSSYGTETDKNIDYKKANLSIYMDETSSCVNLTLSLTENKSDGYLLNDSWIDLNTSMDYLDTEYIWMWADYDCNYSNWRLFNPNLYPRLCANNSVCSTELI